MLRFTPVSLILFGLEIHWYGVLIAAGMALGVWVASRRERALGLPKDTALDLALLGFPCAIVGARLYYVIFSWRQYAADPIHALYIWEGGLAIYGGVLGGVLAGWIYSRARRLPFLKLADLAAPSLALGQAVGRWGNFINQEAYGPVAGRAWQQRFPIAVFIRAEGQWRLATFFYESLWCLLIAAALLGLERAKKTKRPGGTFLGYVFLYALERAFVEGLRADSLYLGAFRVSQLLSLLALTGCAAWMLKRSGSREALLALLSSLLTAAAILAGHPLIALLPAASALVFAALNAAKT